MTETEQIIEDISKQTKVLLQNHWPDISEFRNGEESIKISFNSLLKREGPKTMIETKIRFGKYVTDSVVEWIDPDQLKFEMAVEENKPEAKKRGRPKGSKNILQMAMSNIPSRDPEPGA